MMIYSFWRDEEPLSNLVVGQTLIEQPQNVNLTVC